MEILKAATKAPTNIRKIVPGPITVPAINIACVQDVKIDEYYYLANELPLFKEVITCYCSYTQPQL